MYIQRNKSRYKNKTYECVLIRQCYYENGKIKQKTLANITHLPENLIRTIELAIKEDKVSYQVEDLSFEKAYAYGDMACLYQLMKETGLEKAIYSKRCKERDLVAMMILARILHPSSKLENTRWIKGRQKVWGRFFPQVEVGSLRVDDLYGALDWLEGAKARIEKRLFARRGEPTLYLYDITSTYFEGEKAEGAAFGYNRDKKVGKKQVVIGLTLDRDGYPLSVEVFRGNTQDQSTVKEKVEAIKARYGVKRAVLVGDRGMITAKRMEDLEEAGFDFITALPHKAIEGLIKDRRTPFQLGLFDERVPVEILYQGRRYILCKNPHRVKEDRKTLAGLLRKTWVKLQGIRRQVRQGRLKDKVKIAERVGRWKNRFKVGRFFGVAIGDGVFRFWLKTEVLEVTKALMGCYVIATSVPSDELSKDKVVDDYRSLALVDRAFRTIKTTLLNIHPVYHWKAHRIRAHAFLCMLAYYLVVEMKKRLKELFGQNGHGRLYDLTFNEVLSLLQEIQVGVIKVKDLEIQQLSELDAKQRTILEHLGVTLRLPKMVKHPG